MRGNCIIFFFLPLPIVMGHFLRAIILVTFVFIRIEDWYSGLCIDSLSLCSVCVCSVCVCAWVFVIVYGDGILGSQIIG